MKAHEAQALLTKLLSDAEKACEIARIAIRNRKSLAGDNPYGNRFHAVTIALSTTEGKLRPVLNGLDLSPSDLEQFHRNLSVVKDTAAIKLKQRADALKELRLLCQSIILPKIFQRLIGPKGRLLLRVVVKQAANAYHVITAYKTSNITKYWRTP